MTVYFHGAELADFTHLNGGYSGDTNFYNAANVRSGMYLPGGTSGTVYIESTTFSSTEFWTHFRVRSNIYNGSGKNFFEIWSGGTARLALRYWGTFELAKNVSGTWTALQASSVSWDPNGLVSFDVYVKLGNPGRVSVYINGTPVLSRADLDLTWSGVTAFDKVRWEMVSTSGYYTWCVYSECIVADWNTINSKVVARGPNAAGTYSQWTGSYLDIDDSIPDSVYASSPTADQRLSVNIADFPALTAGQSIESLRVGAYAMRDAAGPQNMNMFIRTSNTDYDGTDQPLAVQLAGKGENYAINPATGVAWTVADLNALEIGVRSRT